MCAVRCLNRRALSARISVPHDNLEARSHHMMWLFGYTGCNQVLFMSRQKRGFSLVNRCGQANKSLAFRVHALHFKRIAFIIVERYTA